MQNNQIDLEEYIKIELHSLFATSYDHDNNALFAYVCKYDRVDVAKYVINEFEVDLVDFFNSNHMENIFKNDLHIDIVKFFVLDCGFDTKTIFESGENILTLTCTHTSNVDVIRFLIFDCGVDRNYTNRYFGTNCLLSACRHNPHLHIIKFLINDLGMNAKTCDNCLSCSCHNPNHFIFKFLVEDCGLDTNHCYDKKSDITVLELALEKIIDVDFCVYILTHYDVHRVYVRFEYDKFIKILEKLIEIPSVGPILFNKFIKYNTHHLLKNNDLLEKINPLFFDDVNIKCVKHVDPLNMKFSDFINRLKKFNHKILYKLSFEFKQVFQPIKINFHKFTLLFSHNNSNFYGDKDIVFNSMHIFKDISNNLDLNKVIILDGKQPDYMINLYLTTCYTNHIDLNMIDTSDFVDFLKFIDQYPSTKVDIKLLEKQIVSYVFNNSLSDPYLHVISKKYQLRLLCFYLHNLKFDLQ